MKNNILNYLVAIMIIILTVIMVQTVAIKSQLNLLLNDIKPLEDHVMISNSTDIKVKHEVNEIQQISKSEDDFNSKANSLSSTPRTGDMVTNSIGMRLVYIPAGQFMMGSNEGNSEVKPVHKVTISKGFYMGQYEVMQAQYESVMGTNLSNFKGDNNPVDQVSWNDAVEFCRKLSQKEGKTYRLPTEAEWEYACRAGSTTAYCFGDSDSQLGHYAWYDKNSGQKAHPVGEKKPNAFGLYDMHGNVWEWCQDWFQDSYNGMANTDPQGPRSGTCRVLRGGCWYIHGDCCRSAYRYRDTPGLANSYYGFRVVCLDL